MCAVWRIQEQCQKQKKKCKNEPWCFQNIILNLHNIVEWLFLETRAEQAGEKREVLLIRTSNTTCVYCCGNRVLEMFEHGQVLSRDRCLLSGLPSKIFQTLPSEKSAEVGLTLFNQVCVWIAFYYKETNLRIMVVIAANSTANSRIIKIFAGLQLDKKIIKCKKNSKKLIERRMVIAHKGFNEQLFFYSWLICWIFDKLID